MHLEEGAVIEDGTRPEDYADAIPEGMVYRYGDSATTPTVTRTIVMRGCRGIRFENVRGAISANPAFELENTPGIAFHDVEVRAIADL